MGIAATGLWSFDPSSRRARYVEPKRTKASQEDRGKPWSSFAEAHVVGFALSRPHHAGSGLVGGIKLLVDTTV